MSTATITSQRPTAATIDRAELRERCQRGERRNASINGQVYDASGDPIFDAATAESRRKFQTRLAAEWESVHGKASADEYRARVGLTVTVDLRRAA